MIKLPWNQIDIEQLEHTNKSKRIEVYNFHQIAAALAKYGFDCIRVADDWAGADFFAFHMPSGEILRVQQKGRGITLARKYENKNLWITFKINGNWYFLPQCRLKQIIGERTKGRGNNNSSLDSQAWVRGGLLTWRESNVPQLLLEGIAPWRI